MLDEALNMVYAGAWFLLLAVPAVGIEALVSYIQDYPSLRFAALVLDPLAKVLFCCDALAFAVFVCAFTIRVIHITLMSMIGINVPRIAVEAYRWTDQRKLSRRPLVWIVVSGVVLIILGIGFWEYQSSLATPTASPAPLHVHLPSRP
jgi:hypothetical protein